MSQDAQTGMQGRTRAGPPEPRPRGPLAEGTQLGPWLLGKLLGAGAMGAVYVGKDEAGTKAAIKVLLQGRDPKARKRFMREARVTEKIQHPNLIRCLGSDAIAELPWIALEFVEGEDLYALMTREGKLSLERARPLVQGVLRGLRAAHQGGVLHRDLKPANVLVARFGEVKLADFGLARRDEESLSITVSGQLMGTPFYMSPEQVGGVENVGAASDVYSIGAILFHLFGGEPPFKGKLTEILGGHLNQQPPPLVNLAPDLPKRLLEIVHQCMEKEPEKRPSLDDLLAAFTVVGTDTAKVTPKQRGGQPKPKPRRPPARDRGREPKERSRSGGGRGASDEGKSRPAKGKRAERPRQRAGSDRARKRSSVAARARRSAIDPWLPPERLPEVPPAGDPPTSRSTPRPSYSRILDGVAATALLVTVVRCVDLGMGGRLFYDSQVMHAVREFLSVPRFFVLLGVTALLLGERFLSRSGARPGVFDRWLIRRRARARASKGDTLAAAQIFEQLGDRTEGARMLTELGRHEAAAKMYLDDGDGLQAGAALERAGRRVEALELYRSCEAMEAAFRVALVDDSQEAAAYLLRYGQVDDAVEVLERGGQPYAAADLLEREGRLVDALRILEQGYRSKDEAGYWKHLGRSGEPREASRQLLLRIAWLLEKLGYASKAAEYYKEFGEWFEAAELYGSLGMHQDEVDCYLAAFESYGSEPSQDQRDRIAALATELESQGDPNASHFLLLLDRPVAAAKLLEDFGEVDRACELYAQASRFAEAGRCAEQHGSLAIAAGYFADAREHMRSAKLYEEADLLELATAQYKRADSKADVIRLNVQLGDPMDGARQLIELGRDSEAEKLLLTITDGSADHYDATLLRADIRQRAKRYEEALELYNECLGEGISFREELAAHMQRVVCYEALGRIDEAVSGLEDLRATSFAPGDLEARLSALQGKRPQPKGDSDTASVQLLGTASPEELVDTSIDRYEIKRMLGTGSFAWVFEARHASLGRQVALKILKPAICTGEAPVRFLREGRALAALEDPNLIKVYDAGDFQGLSYIALEYVDGPTLQEWLEKHAPCPVPKAAQLGAGILSGLVCAHRNKIIHRDLKPANVLLAAGDEVKLVDFGIARLLDDGTQTQADFLGTPRYTSPEQARGKTVDAAADQYAAALIIYELLAGCLPFTSSTTLGWLAQHMNSVPDPLEKHCPQAPPPLAAAIMKALAKDPAERFANIGQLRDVVARFAGGKRSTKRPRKKPKPPRGPKTP